MSVEAPIRPTEQDELEALIEEARRRARRRRLTYASLLAAAGVIAAGAYLLIGGGGGEGAPGGASSNEPGAGAAQGSKPSLSATAYRCPTSIKALKKRTPGNGIPGCSFHFFATLPAGWHHRTSHVTVLPPRLANGIPLGGPVVSVVSYANFRLPTSPAPSPIWPIPTPPHGIAIGIFPEVPASGAESAHGGAVDLQQSDFRRVPVQHDEPLAHTRLYTGGWRFEVQVRAGSNGPRKESIDQAKALLNSIETTQHLCPCGVRRGR